MCSVAGTVWAKVSGQYDWFIRQVTGLGDGQYITVTNELFTALVINDRIYQMSVILILTKA